MSRRRHWRLVGPGAAADRGSRTPLHARRVVGHTVVSEGGVVVCGAVSKAGVHRRCARRAEIADQRTAGGRGRVSGG